MSEASFEAFSLTPAEIAAYAAQAQGIIESSAGDEELTAALDAVPGGVVGLIRFLAQGMALAFSPDRAQGETGVVQIVVGTQGGPVEVWMEVTEQDCRSVETGSDPDTVLRMSSAVFLRIAFKFLTGVDAYLGGLIEASGDVVLATTMDEWFDSPDLTVAAHL